MYYHDYDRLMVVQVSTDPVLRLGTPRLFIESERTRFRFDRGTDIADDGRRFVGVRATELDESERPPRGIHVVLNWYAEFSR